MVIVGNECGFHPLRFSHFAESILLINLLLLRLCSEQENNVACSLLFRWWNLWNNAILATRSTTVACPQ